MNVSGRRFVRFMILAAVCGAPDGAWAQGFDSAQSATSAGRTLASPSVDVPPEWLTKTERTSFEETPRYDETVSFCRRVAEASPWVNFGSFGTSPEGRALPLVIVSRDKAFTPAAARNTGKLIVLLQNGIHAGECSGKDASLMLLRDIAITRTRADLLENVILLVMPIFNVDGHERFSPYSRSNQNGPKEMGRRVTSRRLNLNRDYLKADTVEMRAWLALWTAWRPDLHIDNHTTDGGDWQYDVTFDADTHATGAPTIAKWISDRWYPRLFSGLEADGHVPGIYFNLLDSKDPAKGIRSGGFTPRFSTGYVSLHNRPSILVESHMLKPYRTRVIAHYNLMRHTLELLNHDPASLKKAIAEADDAVIAKGKQYDADATVPVAVKTTDETTPFTFKGVAYRRELSEVSGSVRIIYDGSAPMNFQTVWRKTTQTATAVNPPRAYIIPRQWTETIRLVRAHGLRAERLTEAITLEVESYRFTDVSFAKRPFEGRAMPRFKSERITQRRTYLPGSVIVPMDQPAAKVALHLFEPEAPDSLVRWGQFNTIFEQKEYAEHYVLEPLARRMLREDDDLREEFETKVRTDRDFAGDARARLNFFYRRSPYWDRALNVYPIGRLIHPLVAQTEPL